MKKIKQELGFFKTLAIALICAGFVRSFFFEPFHIPSGSMKPNLLIGDYIFVAKYSYGYSRYSFPFGINFFEGRFWQKNKPQRGDVAVFRLPSNPKINYIKRVIGLPGDRLQMLDGTLYINDKKIEKNENGSFSDSDSAIEIKIRKFLETLPEGKKVEILDQARTPQDNTGIYEVPQGHYFMMGDNRDNSQDSRYIDLVGYVPEENFVGRAGIIFFSSSKPVWQFWNWPKSIHAERILKKIDKND
ncbi:MAG: signal peptidase I [Proteobacteria bacterium]|nr:signal peptidase I [Pseudomonadota bacterium]